MITTPDRAMNGTDRTDHFGLFEPVSTRVDTQSEYVNTIDPRSMALIGGHETWMRRRRLAKTTIHARRGHLIRCALWLQAEQHRTLLSARHDHLDAWQAHLTHSVSSTAERNAISHVRQLYAWAIREQHLVVDPTVRLIPPRVPRRRPRPIREDRLHVAWAAADPEIRAMIALGCMAGLRACEVARLSWTDVDLDGELLATGKGGHERAIWIADSPLLVEALRALPGSRRGPVFPRRDGKPGHNSEGRIDQRVNEHLAACDLVERFHSLRHRFGTISYRAVSDPIAVMRLLGHAHLSATIIYADSSEDVAREALRAAAVLTDPGESAA